MGMLDLSALASAPFLSGLLNSGKDDASLNSVPGYSMRVPDDPFRDLDRKKAEEAAAKAALTPFDGGAAPIPQAGISGQQAMIPGAYGSLAPQMPQAPQTSPVMPQDAPQVAPQAAPTSPAQVAAPVPMPAPRPPEAPQAPTSTDISAQSKPVAPPASDGEPAVPGSSLIGRLQKGVSDNSNMLMQMAGGFAGAGSIGSGMRAGFSNAAIGSQLDQKQQLLNQQQGGARATYDALVLAGAPKQQAIVAAYNPESALSKKLIDTYIGDRKGELKNIFINGVQTSVMYDPYEKTVKDLTGKPIDMKAAGIIDPTLTGDDAAKAAQEANPKLYAKALALKEGRETWPTGRAVTSGDNGPAMDLARQMDPTLTDATGPLRKQTILDYGPKGKTGLARTAASTLMGHAEQYDKLIDRLGAWDHGGEYANVARDAVKSTLGTDKDYLKAKGEASELRNGVANELEKALAGRVSVSGIQEILAPLKAAKGPTEQHAAIQGIIHMLGTRLEEMSNGFDTAMNTRTQGFHMLSPKARDIYKRYGGHVADGEAPGALPGIPEIPGSAPAQEPTAHAAPLAPGNYVYDPKNKSFGPAQ
jgi:hypothetical protein